MKLLKTASFALAATLTVSSVLALSSLPAQAEVTYDSMLEENGGDIPRDHWAANAIQQLVDNYGIMSGYPDKTFRGTRNLTRYEMAAALYQVMKKVDEKVGGVKMPEAGVKPEDLKTIAALQMEFKKELEKLKKDHMALSDKVDMMSRVQVHGGIQVKYRDRIAVTDGTQTTSPLFETGSTSKEKPAADGSFSNNRTDFARDTNGVPTSFNNPSTPRVTVDDSNPFRVSSNLSVTAKMTDGIKAKTSFDLHEQAVANGGHDANEGGGQLVLRQAYLDFGGKDDKGMGSSLKLGFTNLADSVNSGTRLMNHFGNSQWVGHSYGMVGWGGAQKQLTDSNGATVKNSVSRYWVGSLNASNVAPDSMSHTMVSSPTAAFDSDWGWGRFMVGLNYGSTQTDRGTAAGGNLAGLYNSNDTAMGQDAASTAGSAANFKFKDGKQDATGTSSVFAGAKLHALDRKKGTNGSQVTSGLLPLPSSYGDGYGVVGFELDLLKESFPVRLGVHAMSYLNDNILDFGGLSRKEISGVLDLGWNKGFGLTLQVNKSFQGYDKHSLGLMFNDLGGSGFDIGLGANLATRGLFAISDVAAGSAGLYLGVPFVNMGEGKDNLKLVLAARQSLTDRLGAAADANDAFTAGSMFKDSGLTVSLPYMNVGGTPLNLRAEYSMLLANELWSFKPVAHDLSIISSYSF